MNRNNFIISIISMLLSAFVWFGCSDDQFTEKYNDPSTVSSVTIQKLFTGQLMQSREHFCAIYHRYFAFDSQNMGRWAQTFGSSGGSRWAPGYQAYMDDNWGRFYRTAKHFKKLEDLYLELSEEDKKTEEAWYMAGKVAIYAYLVANLDLYGDMPWTEAGKISLTGIIEDAHSQYDKAEDVYKLIIDDLKTVGLRFAPSSGMTKPAIFNSSQDYINDGDFEKWQRFANSIRLRAALRVASNGSITAVGQAAIKEILENPATYPVVEDFDQNIIVKNRRLDPLNLQPAQGMSDAGWSGSKESSAALIKRMRDGDWRLNIVYTLATESAANPEYTVYRGRGPETTDEESSNLGANGYSKVRQGGFFWHNDLWDHQIYSSPETWFIKAEAYLNGWASGDAEDAFKNAVRESIEFYFYYQEHRIRWGTGYWGDIMNYYIDPERPSVAEIEEFADRKWNSDDYENKLDAIITQKWVNFGILYVREAWNEIRRTGYPSGMLWPKGSDGIVFEYVPTRWRYPVSEINYNKYYETVKDRDTYWTKLFWAKP